MVVCLYVSALQRKGFYNNNINGLSVFFVSTEAHQHGSYIPETWLVFKTCFGKNPKKFKLHTTFLGEYSRKFNFMLCFMCDNTVCGLVTANMAGNSANVSMSHFVG